MNLNFDNIKLGEVLDITSSKRVKRADYVTEGIPFFRSKEIIDLHKGNDISTELFISVNQFNQIQKKFGAPVEGDILLTSVGTLGVPYRVQRGDNFYFKDGNLTWFRQFSDRVNSKYLYYWLTSSTAKKKIDDISIGSTQKALTIVALKSLEMALPSIDYQNIVVEILDSISNKIINNRKVNQTLETIAQTLFKSWFVDFDPVKAKLSVLAAGGSAEEAERAAMCAISARDEASLNTLQTEQPEAYAELARTAALFPSAMQDSELGEIPEGWDITQVKDVARVVKGKSYKSAELAESKTALVTLKSFNRGGGYRLDGLKEYTGPYKPDQEVFAGDLVIAYTDVTQAADVIGKPAMVVSDSRYEHLVVSLDVAVVRPKSDSLKYFLYGLAQTRQFQNHTHSHSTGTTVLHLSKDAVPDYCFALPDGEILRIYERMVKQNFESIDSNISSLRTLEKLRDTLLPKLLSGELTLPDKTPSQTNPPENAMLNKQPLTMGVA